MHISICLICCLTIMASNALADPTTQPARKEIFSKAIQNGVKFVVAQEPMTPVAAIKDYLPSGLSDRPTHPPIGYFTLSAELHPDSSPPLRIWSDVITVYYDGALSEYEVLDIIKLPEGRIALVMAAPFGDIAVLDLSITGAAKRTSLRGIDWSLLAAAIPNKPGRLGAKLRSDGEGKPLQLEITDTLQDTRKITTFVQKPGIWEFARVSQRQEKLPQGK